MSDIPAPVPTSAQSATSVPLPEPHRFKVLLTRLKNTLSAVGDALLSRDIDHYPRVKGPDGNPLSLTSDDIVNEFVAATPHWPKIDDDDLDDAIKLARQSLDESKDQTEYQDQKATRLLTVTTFLTALSGVLFTRYNDRYALEPLWKSSWWEFALVAFGYALFGLFLLASLSGALVTFHATRTRFKYPVQEKLARDSGDPKSRLFYSGMISVRPSAWASAYVAEQAAFTPPTAPPPTFLQRLLPRDPVTPPITLRSDLKQAYFRDLVGESYLVAAKAADKLRYLGPAQGLLAFSLKCLLVWLIALPLIVWIVPAKHAAPKPSDTRVLFDKPVPVEARVRPAPTPAQTPSPTATPSPTPSPSPPVTPSPAPEATGKVAGQAPK